MAGRGRSCRGRLAADLRSSWVSGDPGGGGAAGGLQHDQAHVAVATFNGPSWKHMHNMIKGCTAGVVIGREVGLAAAEVAKAQDTMGSLGWKLLVAPFEQRARGHLSGGLAFAAMSHNGLRCPIKAEGDQVLPPRRLGHAVLEVQRWPVFHLCGPDLHGSEGLPERSVQLLWGRWAGR